VRDSSNRKPMPRRGGADDAAARMAQATASLLREIDERRQLLACNPAWLAFTGRTLDDELGRDWSEFLHPEDLARCEQALAAAVAGQAPYLIEYRLRRVDGQYRRVIDAGSPTDAGTYVSNATDVGALEDAGVAVALREQLRDVERRKDEFISAIAHELRNPLTPILNALQLLKTPRLAPADQQMARDMIERQSQQLLRVLEDVLDVSRGKQGRVILRRERLDVAALVRATVEAAQPLFAEFGHRCALSTPDEPLWVDGDRARLQQTLTHLLTHTARQTPRGGRIELRVAGAPQHVLLELSDSNGGVARELLPRIFEPFVKLHGQGGSPAGAGLGLALAKQLVDLHGGELVAHSEGLGRGMRFTLRLPLASGPAAPATRGARRVLVVDDNRDAARIMSLLLTTMGHEVRTAYDGHGALDVFASFAPDTVLLDISLPSLDGCTVGERLRQGPRGKELLLIALTGWGHEADRQRTRAAGFDHHLVKPVDTEVLKRLLGGAPLVPG
jgi:PAS domain S-box-containing protein